MDEAERFSNIKGKTPTSSGEGTGRQTSFKSVSGVSTVHSSTSVFVFPTFFTDALCFASKEIVKRTTPV